MLKKIKKIVRKFPNPIKKIIIKFYNFWGTRVTVDEKMVNTIGDYFSLSKKETLRLLKSGEQLNSDLWKVVNPKTNEEILKFYGATPFYVFDLAYWHFTRAQIKFRKDIVNISKGKVLDFGGGIGDLCVELAKSGLQVDYFDVKGKTYEFAKWLFKRENIDIKMVDSLSDKYDTIICLDVIEHVPNPKEMLAMISEHLNKGGKLIANNLMLENNDFQIHPMHINFDTDYKKYLESLGLGKTEENWLFIKK